MVPVIKVMSRVGNLYGRVNFGKLFTKRLSLVQLDSHQIVGLNEAKGRQRGDQKERESHRCRVVVELGVYQKLIKCASAEQQVVKCLAFTGVLTIYTVIRTLVRH